MCACAGRREILLRCAALCRAAHATLTWQDDKGSADQIWHALCTLVVHEAAADSPASGQLAVTFAPLYLHRCVKRATGAILQPGERLGGKEAAAPVIRACPRTTARRKASPAAGAAIPSLLLSVGGKAAPSRLAAPAGAPAGVLAAAATARCASVRCCLWAVSRTAFPNGGQHARWPDLERRATASCSNAGCTTGSASWTAGTSACSCLLSLPPARCMQLPSVPFHPRPDRPWMQATRSERSPSWGGSPATLHHAAEDEAYASYLAHIVDLCLGAFLLFGYSLAAILIFTLQQVCGCRRGVQRGAGGEWRCCQEG